MVAKGTRDMLPADDGSSSVGALKPSLIWGHIQKHYDADPTEHIQREVDDNKRFRVDGRMRLSKSIKELEKRQQDDKAGDIKVKPWFAALIDLTIAANTIQLGYCTDDMEYFGNFSAMSDKERVCLISEHTFIIIFVIELIYKLRIAGRSYFNSKWNILDISLVVCSLVDVWFLGIFIGSNVNASAEVAINLVRLTRILRILRVLRANENLKLLLEGLMGAGKAMIWVSLLLALLIYSSSIFCVTFFADVPTTSKLKFEDLGQAAFTMFTLCIVADWTDVVTPVIEQHWWASIFFVTFAFIATFGILNLIIGVITERTNFVQRDHAKWVTHKKKESMIRSIADIADIIFSERKDQDADTITKEEMIEIVNSEEHGEKIQQLLETVELPIGYEVTDCHTMFDRDVSGTITEEEFSLGMGRLILSTDFQRSFIIQNSIADVMAKVAEVEVNTQIKIHQYFAELREDLRLKPSRYEDEAEELQARSVSIQASKSVRSVRSTRSRSPAHSSVPPSPVAAPRPAPQRSSPNASPRPQESLQQAQVAVNQFRAPLAKGLPSLCAQPPQPQMADFDYRYSNPSPRGARNEPEGNNVVQEQHQIPHPYASQGSHWQTKLRTPESSVDMEEFRASPTSVGHEMEARKTRTPRARN